MIPRTTADVVVVGTGVAGLTAALRARELGLHVLVVTKDSAESGNTGWAQGGVAVVLDDEAEPGDAVSRHVEDTLIAGVGLCSREVVRTILGEGAEAIAGLRARGARFDALDDGALSLTREGGHSAHRVIHAGGDATGAEVRRALLAAVAATDIPIVEQHCVVELLRADNGAVAGVLLLDEIGEFHAVHAPSVVLATGGLGQLYSATTNPDVATGDGIALALRAGACVADLEFVQFHPTVLHTPGGARGRRPLVTEAVRGEGAVLIDADGQRIMAGRHPLADLAPRDVVSAAISEHLAETGAESVFLDATHLGAEFATRFPTVATACREAGIDPAVSPIPVTSAAHYSCGGVVSTVDGRTGVAGLYAAGEVAATGLHGANRLASNSLLEGLVLGARAAEAVAADRALTRSAGPAPTAVRPSAAPVADRGVLQRMMSLHAGIGRSASGLDEAARALDRASVVRPLSDREAVEGASMLLTAQALLAAASARTESRGCHRRTDFPNTDNAFWRHTVVFRLDVSGWLIRAESRERSVA